MKHLAAFVLILFSHGLFAQNGDDVFYLKNGSVIRGTIIEQNDEVVRMKTRDGNIILFAAKNIDWQVNVKKEKQARRDSLRTMQDLLHPGRKLEVGFNGCPSMLVGNFKKYTSGPYSGGNALYRLFDFSEDFITLSPILERWRPTLERRSIYRGG